MSPLATEIREEPDLDAIDKVIREEKPRLSVWPPSQILAYDIPPGQDLLGTGYVRKGELTTLLGMGGLGKTRLALWLAICQITGREWCGLPTGGEPQRWLLISNENSL